MDPKYMNRLALVVGRGTNRRGMLKALLSGALVVGVWSRGRDRWPRPRRSAVTVATGLATGLKSVPPV